MLEEFNARVMKARYTPVDGPPLITMPRDVEAEVAALACADAGASRGGPRRQPAVRREAPPPKPRERRRWWRKRLLSDAQNRSGSTSGTRCEVRVAPHSSLLIGVHETAAPFLRAGTVRQ